LSEAIHQYEAARPAERCGIPSGAIMFFENERLESLPRKRGGTAESAKTRANNHGIEALVIPCSAGAYGKGVPVKGNDGDSSQQ